MICPKCGYSESNHIEVKKTDEEFFLEWWTPTIGEEAAKASWLDKVAMKTREAPTVVSDIEGYVSQVDGSWIKSKSMHRDHLKQHRMIELGNDVPKQHKPLEINRKSNEARKRQIAEMAYSKLNYR
jgi:hypothetical protein